MTFDVAPHTEFACGFTGKLVYLLHTLAPQLFGFAALIVGHFLVVLIAHPDRADIVRRAACEVGVDVIVGRTGFGEHLHIQVAVDGVCRTLRDDLLEQTVRPRDPALMGRLLEILDRLMGQVRVWKLECNMQPQAAVVSYNAMSGKEKEQ